VAEAGDPTSAISAASRLRPDICLIELELPGDVLNAIRRIAKASPKSQVVVLTRSERPEPVGNAALSRQAPKGDGA